MTRIRNSRTWSALRGGIAAMLVLLGGTLAMAQQQSVVNSPHNLSASGPGDIRAVGEQQVCIFCHTPHHATAVRPLWNRAASTAAYTPYRSNSLQALPDQPTGTSKLCLSCHDGTIALGSVASREQPIAMSGGVTRMPAGASHIGTDLSDDHPVSFAYDQALIQKNPKLRNPSGLPERVKLDENSELQCVSCHEPHDNQYGKFLVMDNAASQLCNTCHAQGTTTVHGHSNCSSCHQPHTAPSGPYLLKGSTVTGTCTESGCHGSMASQPRLNVASSLAKFSSHDTNSAVNLLQHVPDNVVCSDCHEGHTMGNTSALGAPTISPRLGKIDGVNVMGAKVANAEYEYEVCFKCHGENATGRVTLMSRQIVQANKQLQFAPNAISYHPVAATGRNSDVPSLMAGWTTSSRMYCSDCHNSNTTAGSGPNGPHGSTNPGLLALNYSTSDGTAESPSAYALCYRCHDRNSILGDQSFAGHRRHIVEERTPCSACHDSHGISATQGSAANNAHLINFDRAIVQPVTGKGMQYQALGGGTCTLSCHGKVHDGLGY